MKRRYLLGAALTSPLMGTAFAQTPAFPNRAIRIVPFGQAGGPLDVLARLFGEKMTKSWGQPVVVETKPGAGGLLAADFVAKAPADGHTLLFTLTNTQLVLPFLQKVPYDPIKDFQPLTPVGVGGPVLMVRADTPVSNMAEFVAWTKSKGRVTCGTWGQGTAAHLYTELLKSQVGAPMEHVAYKGQGPAHIDLLSGVLDSAWANPATAKVFLDSGKVRVLGIAGTQRVSVLPSVPTFPEQGLKGGFATDSWFGFLAPAKTPRPVVDKIVENLRQSIQSPDVRAKLVEFGLEPVFQSPDEFAKDQIRDLPRWEALIRAAGLKAS